MRIRADVVGYQRIGLGYGGSERTTRRATSLSGGETQRIRLATQIGSRLVGVLTSSTSQASGCTSGTTTVCSAPSRLRDLGNTVIVVEHDADTIGPPTM